MTTIREECDRLRQTLHACRCGADWHNLNWHTWHQGEGSRIWCGKCGVGTPAVSFDCGPQNVQNCPYPTAIKRAADKWNEWASAPMLGPWKPWKESRP